MQQHKGRQQQQQSQRKNQQQQQQQQWQQQQQQEEFDADIIKECQSFIKWLEDSREDYFKKLAETPEEYDKMDLTGYGVTTSLFIAFLTNLQTIIQKKLDYRDYLCVCCIQDYGMKHLYQGYNIVHHSFLQNYVIFQNFLEAIRRIVSPSTIISSLSIIDLNMNIYTNLVKIIKAEVGSGGENKALQILYIIVRWAFEEGMNSKTITPENINHFITYLSQYNLAVKAFAGYISTNPAAIQRYNRSIVNDIRAIDFKNVQKPLPETVAKFFANIAFLCCWFPSKMTSSLVNEISETIRKFGYILGDNVIYNSKYDKLHTKLTQSQGRETNTIVQRLVYSLYLAQLANLNSPPNTPDIQKKITWMQLLRRYHIYLHHDRSNQSAFQINVRNIIRLLDTIDENIKDSDDASYIIYKKLHDDIDTRMCLDNNIQSAYTLLLNPTVDTRKPFLQTLGAFVNAVLTKFCQSQAQKKKQEHTQVQQQRKQMRSEKVIDKFAQFLLQEETIRGLLRVLTKNQNYRRKMIEEIKGVIQSYENTNKQVNLDLELAQNRWQPQDNITSDYNKKIVKGWIRVLIAMNALEDAICQQEQQQKQLGHKRAIQQVQKQQVQKQQQKQ